MAVLRLVRKFQLFTGVCTDNFMEPTNDFFKLIKTYVFIFGMFVILVAGSVAYLYYNFTDLATATNSFIVLAAGGAGLGCYIGIGSNMKSLKILYNSLDEIVENAKIYQTFDAYAKAEEKSNALTVWLSALVCGFFAIGVFGMSFVMSFVHLYNGNYDTASWLLPYYYHNLLPFDDTTILGWYFELFLQIYGGYGYMFSITSTSSFFGGCSYYIEACHLQIKHMFGILDQMNENKASLKELDDHLDNIIIFHNKIFEVFQAMSKINSCAIFFQLICNVVFFSSAIYQTEEGLGSNGSGILLVFGILCVIEGLAYSFIFCFFANLATTSMAAISSAVYESDWYLQPPEIKKKCILIIARSQIPTVFMGFKMISCTLETFTKLTKTATTYYIMFRNVSNR